MANLIDRLLKNESTTHEPRETPADDAAETAAPVPICSKCGKNPRADPDGTNPWCTACKTAYAREHEEKKLARKERKGFALGIAETKEVLASEFEKLGSGMFEGDEIAELIRRAPGPVIPKD